MFVGVSIWKKSRSGKYYWDFMMISLPIFGPLIQKASLSKFSRSLSSMMSSGIPIIKAIEITASAIGNEVYKRRLVLTAEDMRRGIPMAENMANSKLFPAMLVNMIEIGEQTAQLETVTLKVADFYDEEVDNVVNALAKVMEPLIIGIIGVTVGGMVAAIMLPIIQMTNIAGGS
jgi:type IV pilus assembly protein PilC